MKIVAAISRRYEPDSLIEELHKNLHWVDEIICYNDSKRDPKGLEAIASYFGDDTLIMVGDTYHDLQAARQYGCPCVILNNPKLDWIPKGADYYIDSLEELSQLLESIENDSNS